MILDSIVAKKRKRLDALKAKMPLDEIMAKAKASRATRQSFKAAITGHRQIGIIGEIKKSSPSKGLIRADFDPAFLAGEYAKADVQALSVLTEQDFFLGDPAYLQAAKSACALPVLRKDFIIDAWQIYESYVLGADAILLIVALLTDKQLQAFFNLTKDLGLDALVEVHDQAELKRALGIAPDIIGINNRNLNDFSVSLATTQRLITAIPQGTTVVGESGIFTAEDVGLMQSAGTTALLIGESLMRADDIPAAVKALRSGA